MVLSRKKREREVRRDAILRAAKIVFAEKGFDSGIMDEIASKSEFSKGTIYGYFKNKDDLFISLIEKELDNLSLVTESVLKSTLPTVDKIKELIQKVLAYFKENIEFFRIFTPERGELTKKKHPKAVKRIMPKHHKNIEMMAQIMKEGIDKGVLKKIEPTSLAIALSGLIHSTIGRWVMEEGKCALKRDAKIIATIFLDGAKVSSRGK